MALVRGLQKDGEIALFGGEYFDSATDRQLVYGDLFVFSCSKERWRKVVIPSRCSGGAFVASHLVAVSSSYPCSEHVKCDRQKDLCNGRQP